PVDRGESHGARAAGIDPPGGGRPVHQARVGRFVARMESAVAGTRWVEPQPASILVVGMSVSTNSRRVPSVLSIAGSDSGGGAGIQADLKAFARCGVHGMTAITALTAQNTVGVEMVTPVAPEMIIAQVRAVAADIGVDGVKVGMLADEATIDAVVDE